MVILPLDKDLPRGELYRTSPLKHSSERLGMVRYLLLDEGQKLSR
jgi:hypothetical protein